MTFIEVLGVILVPILLFILKGIKSDIRENRKDIKNIMKRCKNCDKYKGDGK